MSDSTKKTSHKKSETKTKKETPKKEESKKETPKSEREIKLADDIKRMPEKQWGLGPKDLKK
jgi:hypothetical protein